MSVPTFGFLSQLTAVHFPNSSPKPPALGWDIYVTLRINTNGKNGSYPYGPNVYAWLTSGPYFSNTVKLATQPIKGGGFSIVDNQTLQVSTPGNSATQPPGIVQLWIAESVTDTYGDDFRTYGAMCSSLPFVNGEPPTQAQAQHGGYIQDVLMSTSVQFVSALGATITSSQPTKTPPDTITMTNTVTQNEEGQYVYTDALSQNGLCMATAVCSFGTPGTFFNQVFDFPPQPPAGFTNYVAVLFSGQLNSIEGGTVFTTAEFGGQTGGISKDGSQMNEWFINLTPDQLPPDLPGG